MSILSNPLRCKPRFNLDSGVSIIAPFVGRAARLDLNHWHGLGRHPLAVKSAESSFSDAVAQDFPRELVEIQCPKPFDIGFRPDIVKHHLADGLKVLAALAGKQQGRLREWYQFSWYRKGSAALSGCLAILEIQHERPRLF